MKTLVIPSSIIKNSVLLTILLLGYCLNAQSGPVIKFSVDLSFLANQNKFNNQTDHVFIRGSFNDWNQSSEMKRGPENVYSLELTLEDNSYYEYKYYITSTGAENSGWEHGFPVSQNGNRRIFVGLNSLALPTVYYNDADMNGQKSTNHFNFIFTSRDNLIIDEFAQKTEESFTAICNELVCSPSEKINIYLYKDLDQLHLACGYPENGPNSVGSAWSPKLVTMLTPSQMGLAEGVALLNHELTHCIVAMQSKVGIPAWLNEGVACYYGRNFSTKAWINSVMKQEGKPTISEIFNGPMGYAYAGIIGYFIIKTKGTAAMAKFIENMDYSDIGYTGLADFQSDWWNFLDQYLDDQKQVSVKFSVDLSELISKKIFNPETDKVFVKGSYNLWAGNTMNHESGTVYSVTVQMNQYNFFEYKFYTTSPNAPNSGWESDSHQTPSGNRLLDIQNVNLNIPLARFNLDENANGIDLNVVEKKVQKLRFETRPWTTPDFSYFKYSFRVLTIQQFNESRPNTLQSFDVGFSGSNGVI